MQKFKYFEVVFTSDERRNKEVGGTNAEWASSLCGLNGSFQTTQSCQILNQSLFRTSPIVMNLWQWLKECFLKRKRWNFCEEPTVWHFATKCAAMKFVELWMSSQFLPNTEIKATMVHPRDQNTSGKIGQASSAGNTHGKASTSSTERSRLTTFVYGHRVNESTHAAFFCNPAQSRLC